tara:strand:+ start:642 stop:2672 length:2031 start_codon:yes stop_codon:yes gene_type:complete
MLKIIKSKKGIKIFGLLLFSLLPWILNLGRDTAEFIKVNSGNVGYYQSNVCDISFAKILITNFLNNNLLFRTTNVENVACVGKIMGMDNIGDKIAIYVGTNVIFDIVFQSIFWILIMSFLQRKSSISNKNLFPIFIIPFLFTLQVIGESRFYSSIHKNYENNITYENLYLLNYLLSILIITIFIKEILVPRSYNFINYLPYVFLLVCTFNLINTNLYLIIASYFGVLKFANKKTITKINFFYISLSLLWLSTSNNQNSFFDVDKLRGFANSSATFQSRIFWILTIFLTINGIWYLLEISYKSIDLDKLKLSFLISGCMIVVFGFFGASNSMMNFLNLYYFGQNKIGINKLSSIAGNTWRGFSSSAESIGEFYAFVILFYFLSLIWKSQKFKLQEIPFLIICIFGLVRANNFAAIISLSVLLLIIILQNNIQLNKKRVYLLLVLVLFLTSVLIYFIIDYFSYGSLSKGLLFNAFEYSNVFINTESYFNNLNYFEANNLESILLFNDQGKNLSSSIIFLLNIFTQESNIKFLPNPVAFISFISIIINRSEKWGLFLAKYDPNFQESLFGYGPLQFSEYYSSHTIKNINGLILPHSSFLNLIIFSGLIGTVAFILYLAHAFVVNRNGGNYSGFLLIFLIVNYLKSDSILYISSLFLFLLTLFLFKNSSTIFNNDIKDQS